jgi:glycosyltransferase involved in cell wall biosynthesis
MSIATFLFVVPTLDSYEQLPCLINSLKQQTYQQWRVLFVDGPSSDAHRSWLDQCCRADERLSWVSQGIDGGGIFGAMNLGFSAALPSEWLLFWGSDDWAASPTVLAEAIAALAALPAEAQPDLLVCRGRYVNTGTLARHTVFHRAALLDVGAYRRALLLGSTPPHQATVFGFGARNHLARYAPGFRLSADLDYFLQLSRVTHLRVQCLDLELVHMATGGISGQQTHRRLQEVRRAYRRTFSWCWWIPFLARYIRRLCSLLVR